MLPPPVKDMLKLEAQLNPGIPRILFSELKLLPITESRLNHNLSADSRPVFSLGLLLNSTWFVDKKVVQ